MAGFAMFCNSAVRAATPPAGLEAGMVNPGYTEKPAWFANSFLDIREDVGEAAAAGKRVLLYFYQDSCWIRILHCRTPRRRPASTTR
jgi:hypothetical protein